MPPAAVMYLDKIEREIQRLRIGSVLIWFCYFWRGLEGSRYGQPDLGLRGLKKQPLGSDDQRGD